MKQFTAIDLFAGAGGATAGLFLAGCDVRLAVECDEGAAATYSANFPGVELLSEMIETYTPRYIREKARLGDERLGIITACPPCQGFSTLGKCDVDDERNDYVLTVGVLVEALHPKALILENVLGLASDSRCSRLEARLRGLGYGLNSWNLHATALCVPQRRKRFVLIAVAGLPDDEVADPRLEYKCTDPPSHPHSAKEVFKRVGPLKLDDPLHRPKSIDDEVLQRIRAIPRDGGSRRDLPDHLQLRCHKNLKSNGAGSVYGRMAWDEPSPTITTRCTTPACGRFLHPEEDRPVTLREAAAFQTFWPSFQWKGGAMSIARQIGNAVPVRLAWLLTLHTIKLIERAEGRF